MNSELPPQPPRVRIEHSSSGRHEMFLDYGEAYGDTPDHAPLPDNELSGIIVASQNIRAFFEAGNPYPRCAAIRDQPTVDAPLASNCSSCDLAIQGGACKPKVRLLLLTLDGQLVMFPLSPTSIKHWKRHLQRLNRSGAPAIAVVTRFRLLDIQKNGFRWAEVDIDFERLVTPDELRTVKSLRADAEHWLENGFEADYRDPGDRSV